ncbi:MAG: hypothetical protein H7A25_12665 [Leptospiraceae bacterium]|nr:hypothetical protein [Leptospiraceae bacterium]MCP5500752.1 hypothetical protein [Leptospiraceae bacterium]
MEDFKDINFKLAVINELMYVQELLEPKFDIFEFAESYKKRKIDTDEEGYDIIPEALEYFKNLQLSAELLQKIERLSQDGGDDVYMNIIPYWDGEDDVFNIKSVEDCKLVPNLKRVTVFYDEDESILEKFREKNIEAEFL